MADLGAISLWIALALASYAAMGSVLGKARGSPALVESSQSAVYLTVLVLFVATISLIVAFINRDFELAYVARHSDLAMPDRFTWVAFYAGNEGSLLFVALGIFVLACGLASMVSGYTGLLLVAALAGLGNATFHPVDFTILNQRVSGPRLGHAFSVHGLTGNLGWAAAPVFLPSAPEYACHSSAHLFAVASASGLPISPEIADGFFWDRIIAKCVAGSL
jgi:hypothetical protein